MSSTESSGYGGVATEQDMGGRQVAKEFALLSLLAATRARPVSSEDVADVHRIITQEAVEEKPNP